MTSVPSNELIPILTSPQGDRSVSGRDLHAFLAVETPYMKWFARMAEYGFIEEQDFQTVLSESTGGRPSTDHALTLDMAKELSMIQRTPRGKQARAYFIEAEKRYREQRPMELSRLDLIELARESELARIREQKAREAVESYARELEPKADAYDRFLDADGSYSVGAVAKMLGLSQNKLFDRLRGVGVLIAKGHMRNTPYQKYMHHFAVNAYEFERSDGTRSTSYTTKVLPSGIEFVSRKLGITVKEVA